jgi:hypothetical protein
MKREKASAHTFDPPFRSPYTLPCGSSSLVANQAASESVGVHPQVSINQWMPVAAMRFLAVTHRGSPTIWIF